MNGYKVLRHLLMTLCICACGTKCMAQDLVVMQNGDSINCYILDVEDDKLSIEWGASPTTSEVVIPLTNISDYKYEFYSKSERRALSREPMPNRRIRLAADITWNHRTGQLTLDELSGIKTGVGYGVEGGFFFHNNFGLGVIYSRYSSDDETEPYHIVGAGEWRENSSVSVQYFAPIVYYRLSDRLRRNTLLFSASYGYMVWQDDYSEILQVENRDYYTIGKKKGNTMGFRFAANYEYRLAESVAVGAQIAWYDGSISKYNQQETDVDNERFYRINLANNDYKKLQRIELSVGLRFYLF